MLNGTPILLYHRVGPHDGSRMDRYTVTPERFEAQMRVLVDHGWTVLPLDRLSAPGKAAAAARPVVITFDDGFASNRRWAWPVLAGLGLPSTTFLVSDQIGGTNAWDDEGMPRYPLLTRDDIVAAEPSLMAFQSHAATHPSMPGLPSSALARELRESKTHLEALTGRPVTFFAYPFGSWSQRVRSAVAAAGYVAACSCRGGRNRPWTDPYLLRRTEILEQDLGWRLHVKLATGLNFV